MQVNTTRFGLMEVEEEKLLTFPAGMVGFPHLKKYFFVPVPGNDVFAWMQAQDDPDVAFLMVDPFVFFPNYDVKLSQQLCDSLQISDRQQVTLLTTVTIPAREGVQGMTTNLLAPVVINHVKAVGQQVILDGSGYKTKHLLFSDLLRESKRRACG